MMTAITSIDKVRDAVTKALLDFEQAIGVSLNEADGPHAVTVTYGKNIVFPTKVCDTRVYPQGGIGSGTRALW
jgi:stage II sporulation protein R